MTKATFTGVSTVAIPVADQDVAKGLYEGLGFEVRFDADLGGGFRWLEVVPPGAATSIALIATGPDLPTGIDTGIRLITPDARAAHAELLSRGLDVGELLDWRDSTADVQLPRSRRQPALCERGGVATPQ